MSWTRPRVENRLSELYSNYSHIIHLVRQLKKINVNELFVSMQLASEVPLYSMHDDLPAHPTHLTHLTHHSTLLGGSDDTTDKDQPLETEHDKREKQVSI